MDDIGRIGKIREKVEYAPSSCGVYIFLSGGKPIYIGKSKNIRERLRAYIDFSDTRETVPRIVQEADDVKWIITPTDDDAFFMEQNLIRTHLPKYNVKLKDVRGFKYVRLSMSHHFPSVSEVRYTHKGDLFFGPFNPRDAREIISAVRRAFGIRGCTDKKFNEFKRKGRPCLDGQVGMCLAPCVGKVKRDEYMRGVLHSIAFMEGRFSRVISELEKKMWKEAEKENFEMSAKIRDRISALKRALDYKRIFFDDMRSADYVGFDISKSKLSVYAVKVREGRIFGGYGGVFEYGGQDIADFIKTIFIGQYGGGEKKGIVVWSGGDGESVKECVSEIFEKYEHFGEYVFRPPESDAEKQIILIAKKNSFEQMLHLPGADPQKLRMLEELSRLLILNTVPRKIEVYDFSNFGGKNLVGVKVHFEDGEIIPSRMRLYKVSEGGHDDIGALKNILVRRIRDFISGKDIPFADLVMIDGGKGHFSVASSIFRGFKLNTPLVCIKKEKRNTRDISLIFGGGEVKPTEVKPTEVKPTEVKPTEVKPAGKLLNFILKLRDAAHTRAKKFALSYVEKVSPGGYRIR